jgi:hypothetical protein
MSHERESIAARLAGSDKSEVAQAKQLLIASAIAIALAGCALPAGRDVRAYDTCMSRHSLETALCEGPRQAYEVDTPTFQARAAAYSMPAGSSYEERPAAGRPAPTPVPLRPDLMPVAAGPNG